jgi:asparagine synthetase B (glutamine-hydrolysing)
MCGFGITNIKNLSLNNEKCQKRGPDLTTSIEINDVTFVHNLLHITGELTPQPFVSDNIVCTYNGEIYNYKELGDYKSDGACIIDQYKMHGKNFAKFLDGEYAICIIDFEKNCVYIAADTFATKPLWFCFDKKIKEFIIASYKSQFDNFAFNNIMHIYPNKTIVYDLNTYEKIDSVTNFNFDLNQYKTNFDDWISAFSNSISKRIVNTNKNFFIGMSSGYDSGAIASELIKQNKKFKAYSVIIGEDLEVLHKRFSIIEDASAITISKPQFMELSKELDSTCENFYERHSRFDYELLRDQAAIGLAVICKKAREDNNLIYLSGHGADEILSDYGYLGIPFDNHNEPKKVKLFPNDLTDCFPWENFWLGMNNLFLKKEEYIAGHYGIETRYPFLDKYLVQEFLWLSAELKNKSYKSCLDEYLRVNNFPYSKNKKRGFIALQ